MLSYAFAKLRAVALSLVACAAYLAGAPGADAEQPSKAGLKLEQRSRAAADRRLEALLSRALYHPHTATLSAHVQDCAIAILWTFDFGETAPGADPQEGYVIHLAHIDAVDAGTGGHYIEIDIKMRLDADHPPSPPTPLGPGKRVGDAKTLVGLLQGGAGSLTYVRTGEAHAVVINNSQRTVLWIRPSEALKERVLAALSARRSRCAKKWFAAE
ncbi:MAG: hypothetical protein MRY74_01530 [Neomegalonema sp.]|nr:hypothetical protein [Neomegalonema sp.]